MAKVGRKRRRPTVIDNYIKTVAAESELWTAVASLRAEILGANSRPLDLLSETPTEASLFASANAVLRTERRTYKYKLYRSKRLRHIHRAINAAGLAHNHVVALHRRYYSLFKKHIGLPKMQSHMAKLKSNPRFAFLKELGSQTLQDVSDRVEKGYQRFYGYLKDKAAGKHPRRVGLPKFRKVAKCQSFTLKQAGWKLDETNNALIVNGRTYKYHASRPVGGTIKTVTLKRDGLGDVYVFFSTVVKVPEVFARTGKSVGVDFGNKVFITASDGETWESPLFHKRNLNALKRADKRLSRKVKGSNNRRKARMARAKIFRHIEDSRRDWFFKLAWELCGRYALICIEDLSLVGMVKLNGRKVNDEAWGEFVRILEHVAKQCGTTVQKVGRTFPSTQLCSNPECGYRNKELAGTDGLKIRDWVCPKCGTHHDRDYNAAVNILREGERLFKESSTKPM